MSWGAWKASGADPDCAELGVRMKASHKDLGVDISSATTPVTQITKLQTN